MTDFRKFKDDMFKKLICNSDPASGECKSYKIDISTEYPNMYISEEEMRAKQTISLVCDILEEYEHQKS